MPLSIGLKTSVPGGGGLASALWLLLDDFTDELAAGAVDGTPATPGPGTRTDSNGVELEITGGFADWSSGASDQYEHLSHDQVARKSGQTLIVSAQRATHAGGRSCMGWIKTPGSNANAFGVVWNSGGGVSITVDDNPILGSVAVPFVHTVGEANTPHYSAFVMRSSGVYIFFKYPTDSDYPVWKLAYFHETGSDALSPFNSCTYTTQYDFVRVPSGLFLPTPLAYDTFTRADGAVGNSETSGPESQTVTQRSWVGAGGSISSNKLIITPTLGSDLITNGDFSAWTADDPDNWIVPAESGTEEVSEVGTGEGHGGSGTGLCNIYSEGNPMYANQQVATVGDWFRVSVDVDTITGGSVWGYIGSTRIMNLTPVGTVEFSGPATTTDLYFSAITYTADVTIDNVVVKKITLASCMGTVETSENDIFASVDITRVLGFQAGLVLCLDDTDTPANFILAYLDYNGGAAKVVLDKYVAGVRTNLLNEATAYSASAALRVNKDGNSVTVYYNNKRIGTTQTISDAGIVSNTKHGLFSTDDGNTFDNFQVMPVGLGSEYSGLDAYIS